MRAALVVIGLAACGFPPEPRQPAAAPLIAAPTTLTARPLHAGQWAVYRERVGGTDVGAVMLAATHEATCGMWFIAELRGTESSREWQFCVGRDGRIVEAKRDGVRVDPAEHTAELEPLRTRVMPPRLTGTFVRQEARVPAGHFFGALRVDGATTTWLHPEVPLGAVVTVRDGDREDLLVAYGEKLDASQTVPQAQPPGTTPSRFGPLFYEAGVSRGTVYGLPKQVPTAFEALRLTAGKQIAERLDVIAAFVFGTNRFVTESTQTTTSTTFWGAGLRWSPALHGTFLQLAAGYAGIGDGNGIGLAVTGGIEVAHGADWGVLAAGDLEGALLYGGDARVAFDGILAIRLDVP